MVLGVSVREFHVELSLVGPADKIDEHQKWVEGTAALADRAVTVARDLADGEMIHARFSAHFMAERAIDAILMGMGLMSPALSAESGLEVYDIRAVLHGH